MKRNRELQAWHIYVMAMKANALLKLCPIATEVALQDPDMRMKVTVFLESRGFWL